MNKGQVLERVRVMEAGVIVQWGISLDRVRTLDLEKMRKLQAEQR